MNAVKTGKMRVAPFLSLLVYLLISKLNGVFLAEVENANCDINSVVHDIFVGLDEPNNLADSVLKIVSL